MVSVAVEVVGRGEREVTVTVELLTADIVDSARGKYTNTCIRLINL